MNDLRQVDSVSKFLKYMPRSNDIILIILKGHLLIEQKLDNILDSELSNSKAIHDARMSFSQRLAVVKSIYGTHGISFPYDLIENLNLLRNQLVHKLEPKDLEKRLEAFIEITFKTISAGASKEGLKYGLSDRLKVAIGLLYNYICGYIEGRMEGKQVAKG